MRGSLRVRISLGVPEPAPWLGREPPGVPPVVGDSGLLAVLRAAARADARLGEDVIGIDLQDARGEREDVEQARLGQGGIDLARCGVFGDDEPAPGRCGAALVQVDCSGVVGQVRVVNAVASHAFALRPLAAQLGDLAQATGKLLGLGDEDGAGLAVAQVDEGGGGGGGDVGFDGVFRGHGVLGGHVALSGADCAVCRRKDGELGFFVVRHDAQGTRGLAEGADEQVIAGEGHGGHGAQHGADGVGPACASVQARGEVEHAGHFGDRRFGGVEEDEPARFSAAACGHHEFARDLIEVGLGKDHAVGEAGGLEDAARAGDGVSGRVGGDDAGDAALCEFGAAIGLVEEFAPCGSVVLRPALEAPVPALEAGCAVGQDRGGLEHHAAARAAGVDQDGERGGGALDGGAGQSAAVGCHAAVGQNAAVGRRGGILIAHRVFSISECGRADLLPIALGASERCVVGAQDVCGVRSRGLARKALEQRVAGEIELDARAVATQGEGDARVGVVRVDVGATALDLEHAVTQRVLHAERGKVGIAQFVIGAARGHGDGGACAQDAFPGYGASCFVQVFGVDAGEAAEHHKDAAGKAGPQTCALGVGGGAGKRHAALERADLAQPHATELVCECGLEALGAARVKLVQGCVVRGERRVRHGSPSVGAM